MENVEKKIQNKNDAVYFFYIHVPEFLTAFKYEKNLKFVRKFFYVFHSLTRTEHRNSIINDYLRENF